MIPREPVQEEIHTIDDLLSMVGKDGGVALICIGQGIIVEEYVRFLECRSKGGIPVLSGYRRARDASFEHEGFLVVEGQSVKQDNLEYYAEALIIVECLSAQLAIGSQEYPHQIVIFYQPGFPNDFVNFVLPKVQAIFRYLWRVYWMTKSGDIFPFETMTGETLD